MKKLIINADDFGRHPAVNAAIIKGHQEGCISSTSLMPGGAAFEEGVALAAENTTLGVGVHFTLIGEQPVADPASIPTLVGADGRLFTAYPQFISRFATGRIRLADIRTELAAQLDKAVATDIDISHVDSHQHLHVLPGIIDIVLDLAAKHKINRIRIPAVPLSFRGGVSCSPGQYIGRLGLTTLARLASYKAQRHGFATTTAFFGMVAGGSVNKACLNDILDRLQPGTTEVMTHPGLDDELLATEAGWEHEFEAELAATLDYGIRTRLQTEKIRLISFHDI